MAAEAPQQANTYRAHAFRRGVSGMVAGQLSLTPDHIRFAYDSGSIELPFSTLKTRLGGNNDDQLFLEDPNHPDWTIYTSDLSILKDPLFVGDTRLKTQLEAIGKRQQRWSRVLTALAICFLVFLGLVGLAVSQKGRMVKAIAARVPSSWETQMGDQLYDQIKGSAKEVDASRFGDLDYVKEKLVPAVTNSGFVFKFHVIEEKTVNAFAVPGGHVFIHTGLLKVVSKPEELAGVLAHEMAHVTQRHAIRNLIESSGLYLIVQYFFGDASGLLAAMANSSQLLLKQKYSRDLEREADDVGWSYLVQAKINPRGMIDFFEKMKTEEAKLPVGTGPAWELLSTHPSTDERIRRLKKLHPEWQR